jgi:hypothetical protein
MLAPAPDSTKQDKCRMNNADDMTPHNDTYIEVMHGYQMQELFHTVNGHHKWITHSTHHPIPSKCPAH